MRLHAAIAGAALLAGAPGAQASAQTGRGDAVADLEAALAAQDSATAVLAARCGAPITASTGGSDLLANPPEDIPWPFAKGATLGFRRVSLRCRSSVVSTALNWYDPALLTPAMNDALLHTDTPFGKVVAPLNFHRERIDSRRRPVAPCPRHTVLMQRARLLLPDGRPLALLVECYQPPALAMSIAR